MSRIISGHVADNSSIISGSGNFNVTNRYYEYTVTFTEPFAKYANVTITAVQEYQTPMVVNLLKSSPSGFTFIYQETQGQGSKGAFHFIAVGE